MNYHLRQTWLAMRGNFTATLATFVTMTLTLLILGSVSLTALNLEQNLRKLESDVEIAAFLSQDADTADIFNRLQSTAQYPEVTQATLISKEQVLEEMTRDYPYIGEAGGLVENPFPDTIRLKLQDPADTVKVARRLERLPGVESVEYGAGYVNQAVRTIDVVRAFGFGLVLLLVLNTLFNILNTVRVAMYARRDEINVMRLLGATRGFIRAPYVLEGLLLGLLSGAISCALLYPGYLTLGARVQELLPALPMVSDARSVWAILGGLPLLGVLLGVLGSLFASSRYLRELE
ncbi:cell division protein FtsX [Deinobacterium chartae]|uniref:Cell division protein FtsX n=1 Tax=Deinobacterium chartae TaxID=521158 RepID=A0A841HWM1_9DEIO|nr:permease-like cell division protein FtsX [Deinobacterium chartae]MBB6097253.1 cell division protein FtsX [Deinobacterium chartae]